MTYVEKARKLRPIIEQASKSLSDDTAYNAPELFPKWDSNNHPYIADDRIQYDSKLYKCLQNHSSQTDWSPDTAVSLWVEIADPSIEFPDWKQPSGAHDAYNKGDKVSHIDKHWVSDINANVYEPSVYGWTEVE